MSPHTRLSVAATGAVIAGCGGGDKSDDSASTAAKPASTGGTTVALAADPSGKIAFDKKALTARAGETTIAFANDSQTPHAVEIEGKGETKTVTGGKASLTVKLKPGKYTFYCPVADHREEGMEGTLTVK